MGVNLILVNALRTAHKAALDEGMGAACDSIEEAFAAALRGRNGYYLPAGYAPGHGASVVGEVVATWIRDTDAEGRWCPSVPLEPLEVVAQRIEGGVAL